MKYKFDYAVLIGRFQPVHNEHLKIIHSALHGKDDSAKTLVIILGSHRAAPNFRNPWSAEEREDMIRICLSDKDLKRVKFIRVRDQLYNNSLWCAEIQQKISEVVERNAKVCLTGNHKDETSFYLNMFPQWKWTGSYINNDFGGATAIRQLYFGGKHHKLHDWMIHTPPQVVDYLYRYRKDPIYENIKAEREYLDRYPEEVKKYPRINVTTDAVVMCSGHILVVRRKYNPGKGLIALPGGFVGINEYIEDSAIRELYEETKLLKDRNYIREKIVDKKVFDHPGRSGRGRIITHAFFIKLTDGPLPEVRGGDDAEAAMWMPLADLYLKEPEFFEDHLHIINHFVNRG